MGSIVFANMVLAGICYQHLRQQRLLAQVLVRRWRRSMHWVGREVIAFRQLSLVQTRLPPRIVVLRRG